MKLLWTAIPTVLLALSSSAQSTWYVSASAVGPGDGSQASPYVSLQYAIAQASTLSGDTLLVLPGSYAEQINYAGKTLAIRSTLGAYRTILQGSVFDSDSLVSVVSGEGTGTMLEGFTLRDGAGHLVGSEARGGAVFVQSSTLEIRHCIFRENGRRSAAPLFVRYGGAIHGDGATLIVEDALFHGNLVADGGGAAVHLTSSSATIRNSGFAFNRIISCPGDCGRGAGMWFEGATLAVEDCWFQENFAGAGGGAYVGGGAAQFLRCRFELNQAGDGALQPSWGAGLLGAPTATVFARRCVFANNLALSTGLLGGAGAGAAGALLEHCTLSGNAATLASVPGAGTTAQNCSLENCIVWNNSASGPALSGSSNATYSDLQESLPGIGNFSLDPKYFAESVADYHLQSGSPCIDAGNPSSPLDPDGSLADSGAFTHSPTYSGGPTVYCTSKVNSLGCLPTMRHNNFDPSVFGPPLVVFATGILGQQNGLLFWGTAPGSFPFLGGTMCISSALVRTSLQSSGGSSGSCSGTYYFSWTSGYLAAQNLSAGSSAYCQFWYRDPADPFTVGITDAVAIQFVP